MMKSKRIVYNLAMFISIGVGIWHFCVPYIYDWYGYLPGIPDILRVSIDWINFFLSLLIAINSLLIAEHYCLKYKNIIYRIHFKNTIFS